MVLIDEALTQAGVDLDQLDGVAVTARPGLIGSLLVGLSTAKTLAWTHGLPLVDVHHIEAHVYSAAMEQAELPFPALALVVSGGHTSLYRAESPLTIRELTSTLDDAAGEAFDKVAHILGLGYPGGPNVSRLAEEGNPRAIAFPRYRPKPGRPAFSFSGIKTAVLYHVRGQNALGPTPAPDEIEDRADVAASFEQAVCDVLVRQTLDTAAREGLDTVLIGGGVACNRRLRGAMTEAAEALGIRAIFPSPQYCTDNAVMIAALGWHRLEAGLVAGLDLDARPR